MLQKFWHSNLNLAKFLNISAKQFFPYFFMFTLFLHYLIVRFVESRIVKYDRVHKIKYKVIMWNCKRDNDLI